MKNIKVKVKRTKIKIPKETSPKIRTCLTVFNYDPDNIFVYAKANNTYGTTKAIPTFALEN